MGGILLYGCKALIFLCHADRKFVRLDGLPVVVKEASLFKQVKYLLFFLLLALAAPAVAQDKAASCADEGRQLCFEKLDIQELPVPPEQTEENGDMDTSQETQGSYVNANKKPEMTEKSGYYEVDIEEGGFYAFE